MLNIQNAIRFCSLAGLSLLAACQNSNKAPESHAEAAQVEQKVFRKEQGTDCDKAEESRTDCARIDLLYPQVSKGTQALKDAVNTWVNHYLFSILEGEANPQSTTLEEAANAFFKIHAETKAGGPSAIAGAFEAQTGTDVVFSNDQYLTLAINGYTYMGGAHGSPTEALNTFDTQTGKILNWDDLVTDKAALLDLAKKKVREVRAEVFKEGFEFDDTFNFVLPACYGLTQDGLFLYYQHYEIMPYALGETELTLTFAELGDLAKIKLN